MKRRFPKKLSAGGSRAVVCPQHGTYTAGVLTIGEREFLSRCPECRDDDAAVDINRLKTDALEVLANLGRAGMTQQRKRRDSDREFFVKLMDSTSSARVAVGTFWASSDREAIEMARLEYPGLFGRLETNTWQPHAELTGKREPQRSVMG